MLIRTIEKFLREHEMPATKFGRLATNDPRFVLDRECVRGHCLAASPLLRLRMSSRCCAPAFLEQSACRRRAGC